MEPVECYRCGAEVAVVRGYDADAMIENRRKSGSLMGLGQKGYAERIPT
jgi:hypothetical protein